MKKILCLLFALFTCLCASAAQQGGGAYSVKLNGTDFSVSREGAGEWAFKPEFVVLRTVKEPKPLMRPIAFEKVGRGYTVTWLSDESDAAGSLKQLNISESTGGDGLDLDLLKGSVKGRTANVFASAPLVRLAAVKAEQKGSETVFTFPENENFTLTAALKQKDKNSAPELSFKITAKTEGYYSVGYVGAPAFSLDELDGVWQPFFWQFKKFPSTSYLTASFHCTLPATFVTREGKTMGVFADSSEFPFQPLPQFANSTFGVALRDYEGKARPMVFAPMLGSEPSNLSEGAEYSFKMRIFMTDGDATTAYENSARELFNYRDLRENAIASTNETLDNMLDYGLSKYSRYKKETKGFSYDTDVMGSTRNDTSITPLAIAYLTDDESIYRDISYPILEFMLSRTKTLFLMDESIKTQNPGKTLRGPCAQIAEMMALYALSKGANPLLLDYSLEKYSKARKAPHYDVMEVGDWESALDMYDATGEEKYLERARHGADNYIAMNLENPMSLFLHNAFFWNKFAPPYANLYRLYEHSGDKKYLAAARVGARVYTMFTWMCPEVPSGNITVNEGGEAPVYAYVKKFAPEPMKVPEESVPAWRVSEIGLTPEACGTMIGHRAIFMVNFAPWMLRVGNAAEDGYLKTAARWAVVGRYSNFPGYHMNTARTTVYEKPDFPLHDHSELSANSFHYNHTWPMMCMLVDFLVSDAEGRSKGAVKFPSRYIDASAYMQSKFYGDRPGKFYDYNDAILWMPRRVLKTSDVNLNYLTARGKDNFYIALTSQSHKPLKGSVQLNSDIVKFDASKTYKAKLYSQNAPAKDIEITGGNFDVDLQPLGISAVAIEGLSVKPAFQDKIFNTDKSDAWKVSTLETSTGSAKALFLNFGKEFKTVFVYLRDENPEYVSAKLYYKEKGKTAALTDDSYPFEFTVPVAPDATEFEFIIETVFPDGHKEKSEALKLKK